MIQTEAELTEQEGWGREGFRETELWTAVKKKGKEGEP